MRKEGSEGPHYGTYEAYTRSNYAKKQLKKSQDDQKAVPAPAIITRAPRPPLTRQDLLKQGEEACVLHRSELHLINHPLKDKPSQVADELLVAFEESLEALQKIIERGKTKPL